MHVASQDVVTARTLIGTCSVVLGPALPLQLPEPILLVAVARSGRVRLVAPSVAKPRGVVWASHYRQTNVRGANGQGGECAGDGFACSVGPLR